MSTKLLVTGGTGFLGAYIIKHLVEKGHAVRAIRRTAQLPAFIPAAVFGKVEWVPGDVLDSASLEDAMEGVGAVIHSAAMVSFTSADKLAMYAVGHDGSRVQLATWMAREGESASPTGSTSMPMEKIAAVQVVKTKTGDVLLQRSLSS